MVNVTWHKAHPMPKRATPPERLQWHVADAKGMRLSESHRLDAARAASPRQGGKVAGEAVLDQRVVHRAVVHRAW